VSFRESATGSLGKKHALVSKLHLGPLAPDLGELLDRLEGDARRLLKDLSRAREVGLGLVLGRATLLVELGKGNVERVERAGRLARVDRLKRLGVRRDDLRAIMVSAPRRTTGR
jgi:hypothetical protein